MRMVFFCIFLILTSYPQNAFGNFCRSYLECREVFRNSASALAISQQGVEEGFVQIPSLRDSDLTIDYLYLPANLPSDRMVIIASGIHGPEAYMGSSLQSIMLRQPWLASKRSVNYLFLHILNPFGAKYGRRVTENNVDLNRNFLDWDSHPNPTDIPNNRNYAAISEFVNPKTQYTASVLEAGTFYFKAATKILLGETAKVRQATLSGQYIEPQGIYFGGTKKEPHMDLILEIIDRYESRQRVTMIMDLHSGYGEKSKIHLFPEPVKDPRVKKAMETIFSPDLHLDEIGSSQAFYSSSGDFGNFIHRRYSKGSKLAIPMLIEYGTANNTNPLGGLQSLRTLIIENQVFWFGAKDEAAQKFSHAAFHELFYPEDSTWRDSVATKTMEALPRYIERFNSITID